MELWDQVKDRDWSLVGGGVAVSNLWTINRHYHRIGGSGGSGIRLWLTSFGGSGPGQPRARAAFRSPSKRTAILITPRVSSGLRLTTTFPFLH